MNICVNPDSIGTIDLDECIGNSLVTINTNFELLKEANCLTFTEIEQKELQINTLKTEMQLLSTAIRGVPKALVSFDGTINPPNLLKKSKITGVDRLSAGVFKIVFETPLPDTNYLLLGTCFETLSGSDYVWVQPTLTQTVSSATINIRNENGVYANPNYASILFFY